MDPDPTPPVPGAPSDNTTLQAVLEAFAADGYDQDMFIVQGGNVRCGACRHDTPASQLQLDSLRRLEGASDPADMAAVLAIACLQCGAKGTAVARYGPEADADHDEVLLALDDHRFREG